MSIHRLLARTLPMLGCFLVALFCGNILRAQASDTRPLVVEVLLQDTVQPVSAESLAENLRAANARHPAAVLLNLSSPGGTADAAETMIRSIEQSPAPVIVFLREPQNQVSGEALRILLAGATSATHPESHLQPLSSRRVRGLSAAARAGVLQTLQHQLTAMLAAHGRTGSGVDTLFARQTAFTGEEALRAGLVDVSARTEEKLMTSLDGRRVRQAGGSVVTLHLQNAKVINVPMSYREHLLRAFMNPDLTVLLLTLGALLIYLEINTPGSVIPGAAGVLLVMLAVYALLRMPLRWEGVVLVLLSALLLFAEMHLRHGALLAVLAISALVVGLRLLVRGPIPELEVDWSTALGTGVGFGGITAGLVLLGAKARRAKVRVGADAMLGWLAVAQTPLTPEGEILVRGELWHARLSGDSFMDAGECVKVQSFQGGVLEVIPLPATMRT